MRILVCGGRDFDNYALLSKTLDQFCIDRNLKWPEDKYGNWLPKVTIIHGGATGADALADQWAVVNWCPVEEYKISKEEWETLGKAAGPIRNQRMIDEGKPDFFIAFPTENSKGTWDMVRRCDKAGIKGIAVYDDSKAEGPI